MIVVVGKESCCMNIMLKWWTYSDSMGIGPFDIAIIKYCCCLLQDYKRIVGTIQNNILDTDIATHLKKLKFIKEMASCKHH